MIIQTIGLDPSGTVWIDDAPNVSRLDPSGAVQADAKHPTRNRKVVGSNPTSGSICAGEGYQARRAHSGGSGGGNLSALIGRRYTFGLAPGECCDHACPTAQNP
jgi:hypothetical protein